MTIRGRREGAPRSIEPTCLGCSARSIVPTKELLRFMKRLCRLTLLAMLLAAGVPTVAAQESPIEIPDSTLQELEGALTAPEGFAVSVFAAPPQINYPTCITATITGELFVCVDKNSSLSDELGRGKILRLVDRNDDGRADVYTAFVDSVDSPRGVVYDGRTLYVMHPPTLTAYRDVDGDGIADTSKVLVQGLGFGLDFRGADHTTNGMAIGIDGWLYIAVGDYGFVKATGRDGTELQYRGGGVVRVRPDGTEMEMYATGTRNIYDVAIDPYLNLFARGNTNDGGGWDVRLNHFVAGAHYGYPSLFTNFNDEVVQPLADYGGGSGTGALYVQDPGLPAPYGDALYTIDWGTNEVARHPLEPNGSTFNVEEDIFIEVERPTDMHVDGASRLYVSSWRDGRYRYGDEDVGYIARLTVPGAEASQVPDVGAASDARLVELVASANQVHRLKAQQELLRRGTSPERVRLLEEHILGDDPVYARVAALFTLKQLQGSASHDVLVQAVEDPAARAYALRALADRKSELLNVPTAPFVDALSDADPHVQLQAITGLKRLGATDAADAILPLTASTDPVIPHIAVDALVALEARDASLEAVATGSPDVAQGALRVLQQLHDAPTVSGLIELLPEARSDAIRSGILQALARLHYREGVWRGTRSEWWGTRPSTIGPYYDPVAWAQSLRIRAVLEDALLAARGEALGTLADDLQRNRVLPPGSQPLVTALVTSNDPTSNDPQHTDLIRSLMGRPSLGPEVTPRLEQLATQHPTHRPAVLEVLLNSETITAEARSLLVKAASDTSLDPALRAAVLERLARGRDEADFQAAVQAFATLDPVAGLHPDLDRAWRQFASARVHGRSIDAFRQLTRSADEGERFLGYAVLLHLAMQQEQGDDTYVAEARRAIEEAWNGDSAAALLQAIGYTEATGYADQIQRRLAEGTPAPTREAAQFAAERLGLGGEVDVQQGAGVTSDLVRNVPYATLVRRVSELEGDPALGETLFMRQACMTCHTASPEEALIGPYLGDIATRYDRAELVESIVRPAATIAQGFATHWFELRDGSRVEGFITTESGDRVEIHDQLGTSSTITKDEIVDRGERAGSLMPPGLVDHLTVEELASLVAYLESLDGGAD